jgi:hypothetical protein
MDMVTRVSRFLRPGETMKSISFKVFPGRNGANQAVALGDEYRKILASLGTGISGILTAADASTGTASI